MNKTKVTITIVSTLLIGFILGFFLSGRLAHSRIKQRREMMTKPGVEQQFIMKQLELTEEQNSQISPILDSMINTQINLRQTHRSEMDQSRKAMFDKIKPLLNEHQRTQLKDMQRKMRPGPRHK